jgi:hypothetical protein
VVALLEMKEGTTSLGARVQSAIQRAAVLYKPRLATFNFTFLTLWLEEEKKVPNMHVASALR